MEIDISIRGLTRENQVMFARELSEKDYTNSSAPRNRTVPLAQEIRDLLSRSQGWLAKEDPPRQSNAVNPRDYFFSIKSAASRTLGFRAHELGMVRYSQVGSKKYFLLRHAQELRMCHGQSGSRQSTSSVIISSYHFSQARSEQPWHRSHSPQIIAQGR